MLDPDVAYVVPFLSLLFFVCLFVCFLIIVTAYVGLLVASGVFIFPVQNNVSIKCTDVV